MSAYHLNGIFGNSGENSNGTVHPGGMFSVIPFQIFLFLALTGMPGNFGTICPQLENIPFHLFFN